MIRFLKSHVVALYIVALTAATICFAYLPALRAWPDIVPSGLRSLFIVVSMPWSLAMLTPIDAVLWKQSHEINVVVPELLIAFGFGFNVAVVTALAWFGAIRNAGSTTVRQ